MYQCRRAVTQILCYEFCIEYKQLKAIVIVIGNFVIVIDLTVV